MKFASVTRISTSALISPSASLTSFYNRHNFALSKGVLGMMTTLVLSNWSLMTNMCSSPQSLWKQSCVALWLTRTKPKLNSHPSLHLEMGRNAYRDLISNKIWDRAWFKISSFYGSVFAILSAPPPSFHCKHSSNRACFKVLGGSKVLAKYKTVEYLPCSSVWVAFEKSGEEDRGLPWCWFPRGTGRDAH